MILNVSQVEILLYYTRQIYGKYHILFCLLWVCFNLTN